MTVATARIVVICVAKRYMMDAQGEVHEVAVAQGDFAQWFRVGKELWDSAHLGSPIGVEDLQ